MGSLMQSDELKLDHLGLKQLDPKEVQEINGGIHWLVAGLVGAAIYDCISSGDFERGFRDAIY